MTGVRRATEADILMMFDLVEYAREDFDVLPVGAPVTAVEAVFVRYVGYAGEDCPSGLVWLRVGPNGVVAPCRLLRWVQREMMRLCEFAVYGVLVSRLPPFEVSLRTQLESCGGGGRLSCFMCKSVVCFSCKEGCKYFVSISLSLS